ncbi:MAG: hypothetical protein Q9208_006795 [Pyrenodesmia sp. 3 TL-2023]
MGPDTNCLRSDHSSLNDLEEMPHSDTASINPAISCHDSRSATQGATDGGESVGTTSLNAIHPYTHFGQPQNSLDVLERSHRDPSATASINTAADVALPESEGSRSSVQEHINIIGDSGSVHRQRYLEEIRRLSTYMPHLINVSKSSRAHHRAELQCLDFNGCHLVSSKDCKLEQDATQSQAIFIDPSTLPSEADGRVIQSEEDFINSFMRDIFSEVDCRVLLVDDLSDTLMYILGSCLHITPEFFEEHLLKSGWHDKKYGDPEIRHVEYAEPYKELCIDKVA